MGSWLRKQVELTQPPRTVPQKPPIQTHPLLAVVFESELACHLLGAFHPLVPHIQAEQRILVCDFRDSEESGGLGGALGKMIL